MSSPIEDLRTIINQAQKDPVRLALAMKTTGRYLSKKAMKSLPLSQRDLIRQAVALAQGKSQNRLAEMLVHPDDAAKKAGAPPPLLTKPPPGTYSAGPPGPSEISRGAMGARSNQHDFRAVGVLSGHMSAADIDAKFLGIATYIAGDDYEHDKMVESIRRTWESGGKFREPSEEAYKKLAEPAASRLRAAVKAAREAVAAAPMAKLRTADSGSLHVEHFNSAGMTNHDLKKEGVSPWWMMADQSLESLKARLRVEQHKIATTEDKIQICHEAQRIAELIVKASKDGKLSREILKGTKHSARHRIIEAMMQARVVGCTRSSKTVPFEHIEEGNVFLLQHDWTALIDVAQHEEWRLPYPVCIFECRINGVAAAMFGREDDDGEKEFALAFECPSTGGWFVGDYETFERVNESDITLLYDQVKAACISLDAELTYEEPVRAPERLNRKRVRSGKPPLRDYHTISLAKRTRAAPLETPGEGRGPGVRLHVRRGHYRHYESHKTWIKAMLVGDPDLGFVNKEYKL